MSDMEEQLFQTTLLCTGVLLHVVTCSCTCSVVQHATDVHNIMHTDKIVHADDSIRLIMVNAWPVQCVGGAFTFIGHMICNANMHKCSLIHSII